MPDLSRLTERQKAIYEFVRGIIIKRGYGPTVREIGDAFDISSPNGVSVHLRSLQKKGLIHRNKGEARAITIVGMELSAAPPCRCPRCGHVIGEPVEMAEVSGV